MKSRASIGVCGFAAASLFALPANAIEIPNLAEETLTLDVSNTTDVAYHFDNRNDSELTATNQSLVPSQQVDDNYGEWINRLYVRAYYWKFALGLRLDSAVYFNTMSRQDAQDLIIEKLGEPGNLDLENRFGRELHSRYSNTVYPAKLWLRFKHKGLEATVGDFYAHLGRGLVFSVRKIDEVGVDTTVRGGKLQLKQRFGETGMSMNATLFGGQMNPLRIDFPTGRLLHGSGSPLFFGFPTVADYQFYEFVGPNPDDYQLATQRARPSYLEDNVVGGNVTWLTKRVHMGFNSSVVLRQSNSADFERCKKVAGRPDDDCQLDFPTFSTPDASRSHDTIATFSQTIRIPPIAKTFDGYLEVAEQRMLEGRVIDVDSRDGNITQRERDIQGFALYANTNFTFEHVTATFEAKHYRSFFTLGANIDTATLGFGAPEYSVVAYNRPPNAESIYTEPINSPDLCVTGGRGKVDTRLTDKAKVFGWLGRYTSWSEVDPGNNLCDDSDELRTDTWDAAVGTELEFDRGTHYWAWIGARATDRKVAASSGTSSGETKVFYREGYVRYDFGQHLSGDFSITMLGNHRRRYEPIAHATPWHEGENLLALNWNPHFSFIWGVEYQTKEGFPTTYFNGAIQYYSKRSDVWWGQLVESVRVFVGQRRSALRCVGGVCRIFPAFEGAKLELVSRF